MKKRAPTLIHNFCTGRSDSPRVRSPFISEDVALLRGCFTRIGRAAVCDAFRSGGWPALTRHRLWPSICILAARLLQDRSPRALVNEVFPVATSLEPERRPQGIELPSEDDGRPNFTWVGRDVYRRALSLVAGDPEAWEL